ncbi:MAG: D-alanine--D-alanine ligase [Candidatus Omnitrophota bacterium]|nr:D-alanine--D-alanine ligase [Candidatus Omnitrophota bacterium]
MKNNGMEALRGHRIGVLAGGPSSERDISLKSARAVFGAFQELGLNTVLIEVEKNGSIRDEEISGVTVAFIAMHGKYGEDGTVQSILEGKGIPYSGSGPEASRIAFDKIETKKRLHSAGIKIPEYEIVRSEEHIVSGEIGFPCVIKPAKEGSSIGLSFVPSEEGLKEAVREALKFGPDVIAERYISGREITVGILDEKALPVVEIEPECGTYDFHSKYTSSRTKYIVPAGLTEEAYGMAQDAGLKAHKVLGCSGFSRVDMIASANGDMYVLEVNTIPGLTERSLLPMAAREEGIDFSELCVRMLLTALSAG